MNSVSPSMAQYWEQCSICSWHHFQLPLESNVIGSRTRFFQPRLSLSQATIHIHFCTFQSRFGFGALSGLGSPIEIFVGQWSITPRRVDYIRRDVLRNARWCTDGNVFLHATGHCMRSTCLEQCRGKRGAEVQAETSATTVTPRPKGPT